LPSALTSGGLPSLGDAWVIFVSASALSRNVVAQSMAAARHSLWFTWLSVSARRYRKMD